MARYDNRSVTRRSKIFGTVKWRVGSRRRASHWSCPILVGGGQAIHGGLWVCLVTVVSECLVGVAVSPKWASGWAPRRAGHWHARAARRRLPADRTWGRDRRS